MKGWHVLKRLFQRTTGRDEKEQLESAHQLMAVEAVQQQLEQRVSNLERERRIVARDHSQQKPSEQH